MRREEARMPRMYSALSPRSILQLQSAFGLTGSLSNAAGLVSTGQWLLCFQCAHKLVADIACLFLVTTNISSCSEMSPNGKGPRWRVLLKSAGPYGIVSSCRRCVLFAQQLLTCGVKPMRIIRCGPKARLKTTSSHRSRS